MAELIKLANWPGKPRGHVIFVHGLGGHAYNTWRTGTEDNTFWPLWLARDIKGVTVWTVSYAAPPTNWLGNALRLQDRAVTILERLLGEPELAEAPIAFVGHSLGGLVVKQVLREASDQKGQRPEAGRFLDRVKAVVFVATPHTGSTQASWLEHLSFISWPSLATQDLVKNDANLRNLNVWYRNNLSKRVAGLVFYETAGTAAGTIVDAGSADPGLPGVPIPIESDHIAIAKPEDDGALIYARTRDFLAKGIFVQTKTTTRRGPVEIPTRPPVSASRSKAWAPRAIRIVAIIVILLVPAFIGFRALQFADDIGKLREEIAQLQQSSPAIAKQAEAALNEGEYARAETLVRVSETQGQAVRLIEQRHPDRALEALNDAEQRLNEVWTETSAIDHLLRGYIYKTYARAYSSLGKNEQALSYLGRALDSFKQVKDSTKLEGKAAPEFASAYNGIGNIYYALKDHRQALEAYELATKLAPDYAYAWHDMFLAYYELAKGGDVDLEAMREALLKAQESKEAHPNLYYDLDLAPLKAALAFVEQLSSSGENGSANSAP